MFSVDPYTNLCIAYLFQNREREGGIYTTYKDGSWVHPGYNVALLVLSLCVYIYLIFLLDEKRHQLKRELEFPGLVVVQDVLGIHVLHH